MAGFAPLPASEIDGVLNEMYGRVLANAGFSEVRRRRWARSRMPLAHDVFELQSLKGATISPRWGLSLVYAPHVQSGRLRWHRTLKSVVLDMTVDPVDFLQPNEIEAYALATFGDLESFRRAASTRCERALTEARLFWEQATNLAEIAALFERRRSTKAVRFDFYNYVQHPVAYAFTLAKLGRRPDAESEIERSAHAQDADLKRLLSEALDRVERAEA